MVVDAVGVSGTCGVGRSMGRRSSSREGYGRSAGQSCVRVGVGLGVAVYPGDRGGWIDWAVGLARKGRVKCLERCSG